LVALVCIAWVMRFRRSGNFDASKLFIRSTALLKLKIKSKKDVSRQFTVAEYTTATTIIITVATDF
jgi:hypothetical protein